MEPPMEPPLVIQGAKAAGPAAGPGATAASRPIRAFLAVVGSVALALGVIGLVVPVLPTTPFLLLAAACYARASTRLYGWLIGSPALGPIITDWRHSRSLPPGVKARAVGAVILTFGISLILVDSWVIRAALLVVAAVLLSFLVRIPTRR